MFLNPRWFNHCKTIHILRPRSNCIMHVRVGKEWLTLLHFCPGRFIELQFFAAHLSNMLLLAYLVCL